MAANINHIMDHNFSVELTYQSGTVVFISFLFLESEKRPNAGLFQLDVAVPEKQLFILFFFAFHKISCILYLARAMQLRTYGIFRTECCSCNILITNSAIQCKWHCMCYAHWEGGNRKR